MRIIVNEKQYKKLLYNQQNTKKYIQEWVNYVGDVVHPYLNKDITEDTISIRNIKQKIGKHSFFKKLPIENIGINILRGDEGKMYLGEIHIEDKIIKNLELDVVVNKRNKNISNILEEFIKIDNNFLLNEQYQLKLVDGLEDKLTTEKGYDDNEKEELLDTLSTLNAGMFNLVGKPIVVKDIIKDENIVIIDDLNLDDEDITNLLLPQQMGQVTTYWDMRKKDDNIEIKLRDYSWDDSIVGDYFDDSILVEPEYHDHDHDDETDDEEETDDEIVVIDPNDIDKTFIKPSEDLEENSFGWREKIDSLCKKGKTRYCDWHFHDGEDYSYPVGTEIYVFKPGKVINKGNHTLTIKHDDGSTTKYAHCDKIFVKINDTIESGKLIGTVGGKGYVTGTHLHFEYSPPDASEKDYTVTKKSFKTDKQTKFSHKSKNINPKNVIDDYIRFKKK